MRDIRLQVSALSASTCGKVGMSQVTINLEGTLGGAWLQTNLTRCEEVV